MGRILPASLRDRPLHIGSPLSDPFERLKAALAGRYAITREIGSGGMATVYLAEDLRHHRKVAVKVLRPELAATMGSDRFLHEIEIAAQLQNPHILPLLDSGDADGFLYYVMPFIEGQTLRDRLLREGELPIAAAVKILSEVVDALVEAHGRGVIHRDIKPENVLLTGRHALVADFGVAKAVNEATGRHKLTTAGVALGTPAYMAPEQASAEPNLDARVDLYAVGAMAYEMLTGRPPFTGTSAQQILAAHMTQTPEAVTRHRASIPPALDAVVMKCLAKRPSDRWQSAEELLAQLEPIATTPSGGTTPTDARPVTGVRAPAAGSKKMLVIGGVAGIVLVAIAAALLKGGPEARIEFGPVKPVTSDPGLELHPALSPDGKTLAYVAGLIGQLRVYVRSLSGGTPIPVAKDLAGNQQMPRWSPDGTRLLFTSGGSIQVVPSLGGAPRVVVAGADQPAWSADGKELAYVSGDTLFVRGIEGGTSRLLATGLELHSPVWSPDGRFIAYVSTNRGFWLGGPLVGNLAPSILMVVPAAGGLSVKLSDRKFLNMSPTWMPDSRHLLFMSTREGGRDLYSLLLDGSGHPRGAAVRLTTGLDIGTFSLSADGSALAYSSFPNTSNIWAIPIPAAGTVTEAEARQITTGTQHIEGVAVSRDGQWLAFDSDRQGNPDIYRMPIAGGEPQQVTSDPSFDFIPSWSPDGKQIVFQSWRNETRDVFVVNASGGNEQLVAGGPAMEMYADWSADGRSVVFYSDRTGQLQLYSVTRGADGKWQQPRQLSHEGGNNPRWSPDGRAIVYLSNRGMETISPDGGAPHALVTEQNAPPGMEAPVFAVWSPDSRTIYFKAAIEGHAAFWAIPAAGGKPRLLVRFENPAFASARQEFATDGKRLYFTADDRQSDIKVMEVRRPR
jgi:eukaryotic-like serine/threonine-protein kinase